MTGLVKPWAPRHPPRRGARPRPRSYVDNEHKPPYTQDRMWWPSDQLGTYRKADQAGDDNTEET